MDVWTAQLRRWPMLAVVIFGQISNGLSVLVLARRKLRKNTCSLYLLGASLSNTLCIFVGLFYVVISSGFGYSLAIKSRFFCKFLPFMYYSTLFLASWFVLFACIDRYCSTHLRANIRRLSHINIAKLVLVFLPLLSCLVHMHFFFYVDLIPVDRCTFLVFDYLLFIYVYYVVVYAFMTPILYVVFAVLTIHNVRKTKRTVALVIQRLVTRVQRRTQQQNLNAQLLRMLLVQVMSFVTLTMPLAAWNVYSGASYYQQKSDTTKSIESLLSVLFRLLTFINIGLTCVVYTITSRLFREELWSLLHLQRLKTIFRRERLSPPFSVSRRIAPA